MKKPTSTKQALTKQEKEALLNILCLRFEAHTKRHRGIVWSSVEAKLRKQAKKLWSLNEMERTGGEPDVTEYDKKTHEYIFIDCAAESPKGRRSLCYDNLALTSRKEHAPENSALALAAAMGIEILDEREYRKLQKVENFDTKTSSWIKTPADIRKLGGALFCDRRYETVFTYHNGADSYYASRAFRGLLRV